MNSSLLLSIVDLARIAGDLIIGHYEKSEIIEIKKDGSPLTRADKDSHELIIKELKGSNFPVVSEESSDLHMGARKYWLVDPLDGTKDFIAANHEFSVNIALIEDERPLLGVVYAPALQELYAGGVGLPSWIERHGRRHPCQEKPKSEICRLAVSRFHDHPDIAKFAIANGINEYVAIGSALKYARLATAEVDVFPRLVGSSEWDTAAGQAVLEGAGGKVLDWSTGKSLRYGKPFRRNPRLLSMRTPYTLSDFITHNYEKEVE